MDRSVLAPLLLVALLSLAGCAGSVPGTNSAAESYPAGISPSGVNATAATDAHDAALNGSSFTLSVAVERRADDRSRSMSAVQRVGADREAVLSSVETDSATRTIYLTADRQYLRTSAGDRTTYDVRERTPTAERSLAVSPTAASLVNGTLASGNFTVAGTEERNGTTLTTLEASSLAENAPTPTSGAITAFDATVVVDERSVVRSLSYSIELTRQNRTYSSSISMNVTEVGSTDVAEPAWIAEAENRSSTTARSEVRRPRSEPSTPLAADRYP